MCPQEGVELRPAHKKSGEMRSEIGTVLLETQHAFSVALSKIEKLDLCFLPLP